MLIDVAYFGYGVGLPLAAYIVGVCQRIVIDNLNRSGDAV